MAKSKSTVVVEIKGMRPDGAKFQSFTEFVVLQGVSTQNDCDVLASALDAFEKQCVDSGDDIQDLGINRVTILGQGIGAPISAKAKT